MTDLIHSYLDWLRVRGCSPRTIGARREILHRIDDDLPYGIDRATADELTTWLYRDGWSPATKATYFGAIRGLYVWATDPLNPVLDFDPTALLPRPNAPRGLPRPVTDDQLATILTHAAEPYRTWAELAAYEGLRCCEIAGLHRDHITEQNVLILRGKGGAPGIVPTHPTVWARAQRLPPGPLALTHDGQPASARYISLHALLHFRRHLGLDGVSMHRLRHWYGTTIYRKTRDLRRTQELLRHRSPQSTAIYTLISDEERTEAVRALPTFTDR